jgi:putative glycosyltransferase (TIGR04372 family)
VCVQNRTPGFYAPLYESEGAGLNDQDFRDCAIANFIPAISEIVSAGGWCIRVGDSFTEPLAPMEGVIDYAHSNIKSDWMDVFLCASCRFFVGNTSGLNTIPTAFGVPVIRTNVIPMSALVKLCKGDLGIPKLVHRGGETLPFADVLGSDLGSYYVSSAFRDAGVTHAENSPEDVCDLVVEMLEALDGRASYDEHDRALQAAFRRLVQPHHFCHGSTSRIGRDFLRRHAHLL